MRAAALAALLAGCVVLGGCGQDDKTAPSAGGDAAKGRQIWLAQCVACHNVDPSKDGAVGPAVKGSSAALVEARVLHASYPPGYQPKRTTKVMPERPDLRSSIPDLAAYLR